MFYDLFVFFRSRLKTRLKTFFFLPLSLHQTKKKFSKQNSTKSVGKNDEAIFWDYNLFGNLELTVRRSTCFASVAGHFFSQSRECKIIEIWWNFDNFFILKCWNFIYLNNIYHDSKPVFIKSSINLRVLSHKLWCKRVHKM